MTYIFDSLIPIFSLILIGYFFKKINFPSNDFWSQADKLTYYILMPALLIFELSNAKIDLKNSLEFVSSALLAIIFTMFFLILINRFKPINASSFTSVMQGGIRFNTYLFLALAGSIFGKDGLILSAILLTFAIPFLNILCITIFALYIKNEKLNFLYLIKSIITNPLIIACFVGGSINFFAIELPIALNNTLAILSKGALVLGLLSIGFALVIKDINSFKYELGLSSLAKFVVLPIFIFIFGTYFELEIQMISILVLFAVLPTAPSSFILARQLGGNIGLMSSIITIQTLLSMIFIILFLKIFI